MAGETWAVTGYPYGVRLDIDPTLGKDWILDLTCRDGSGAVIDVTSATVKWRLTLSGTTVLTAQTGGSGITISNGTAGTLRGIITPTVQTSNSVAAATAYKHEIELTTSGGTKYDMVHGYLVPKASLF